MSANVNGCFLDRKALGQAIKKQRKLYSERPHNARRFPNGFTQQDLCDFLNTLMDAQINVKTLSRIETGKQEPSLSQIVQIAFVLGGAYWRATLCEMVEESIVGDPETDQFAWMKNIGDSSMLRDNEERATERLEEFFELQLQMEESVNHVDDCMERLSLLFIEMNRVLSDPHNALMMKRSPINEPQREATPAPTPGAVAIDEPEGKEHEHEQD